MTAPQSTHGARGGPVEIVWRQRRWACLDPGCPRRPFSEQVPALVAPRGSITTRAIGWSIGQPRAEHATIHGLARQLCVAWWTLWRVVKPRLEDLAGDESRFDGVGTLEVDEHVWHHTPHKTATKGPGMFTGMVDQEPVCQHDKASVDATAPFE